MRATCVRPARIGPSCLQAANEASGELGGSGQLQAARELLAAAGAAAGGGAGAPVAPAGEEERI